MADLSFFWHDYETFGRVPRRDRPAQFAGLRTDAELKAIDDPVMWFCQPAPDTLPDPESVLLTGILPQQALAQGMPEHAFAAAIESQLAKEGTVGVGYNSIRFDDEVTRFLFWRNLIDPYAREWQNGCGRWDLLDVVRCTWALRPDGIQWPLVEAGERKGKPSFRLEQLTQANGLAHEAAHDALSDVRATIALAQLIRNKQPRLWDFCLKLRSKHEVWAEIGTGRPFLHLSGMYPVEHGCMAIVWPLAVHPTNKNELIVWDLAQDPTVLSTLDPDTIRRLMFTRQDELAEGEQRLPIKTIHVNKSPVVVGNLKTLGAAEKRWQLDLPNALKNADKAARLGRTLDTLWPAVFSRPNAGQPVDVDEDLYGGFLGQQDRRSLDRLRSLSPEALAGKRPAFDDPRLEELLFRYRARNFSRTLDANEQSRWQQHLAARLHQGQSGGLSLAAYFERIDTLAEQPGMDEDPRAMALLESLVDYAEGIAPEQGN